MLPSVFVHIFEIGEGSRKREPSSQSYTSIVYHYSVLEYSGAGNMSISIASQYPKLMNF